MKRRRGLGCWVAERRVAADPVSDVSVRESHAVFDPVAQEPARELRASAKGSERSAFQQHAAAGAAAAFVGNDVDHAADRIGPVKRRPGTAHHFDAAGVGEQQVLDQSGGVGLRGGGIPQAQAVHEHGGVLVAQAPDLDGGEGARAAKLLHAHAGGEVHYVGKRGSVAGIGVAPVDHGNGFGYMFGSLGRTRMR